MCCFYFFMELEISQVNIEKEKKYSNKRVNHGEHITEVHMRLKDNKRIHQNLLSSEV